MKTLTNVLYASILSVALIGCGGGGGDSVAPTPPPPSVFPPDLSDETFSWVEIPDKPGNTTVGEHYNKVSDITGKIQEGQYVGDQDILTSEKSNYFSMTPKMNGQTGINAVTMCSSGRTECLEYREGKIDGSISYSSKRYNDWSRKLVHFNVKDPGTGELTITHGRLYINMTTIKFKESNGQLIFEPNALTDPNKTLNVEMFRPMLDHIQGKGTHKYFMMDMGTMAINALR